MKQLQCVRGNYYRTHAHTQNIIVSSPSKESPSSLREGRQSRELGADCSPLLQRARMVAARTANLRNKCSDLPAFKHRHSRKCLFPRARHGRRFDLFSLYTFIQLSSKVIRNVAEATREGCWSSLASHAAKCAKAKAHRNRASRHAAANVMHSLGAHKEATALPSQTSCRLLARGRGGRFEKQGKEGGLQAETPVFRQALSLLYAFRNAALLLLLPSSSRLRQGRTQLSSLPLSLPPFALPIGSTRTRMSPPFWLSSRSLTRWPAICASLH